MPAYNHVMVAVDLTEEAKQVADKAVKLVGPVGRFSIVHVLQPLDSIYLGEYYGSTAAQYQKFQDDRVAQAKQALKGLADEYGCSLEHQYLLVGKPAKEIHKLADNKGVDLVVIGTHGQHGLALLLGSTANAVLHGSNVDVLAVRIQES